jgi:4-hydroxybenzoate polyprenyltransferase
MSEPAMKTATHGPPSGLDLLRLLRPNQWTKNAVVLAAFFFAFGDQTQHISFPLVGRAVLAALLFCVVSSGVYIINDIRDYRLDQLHPVKRLRPIAADRVARPLAAGLAVALLVAGGLGAWALAPGFAWVLVGYAALQLLYTAVLKQVPLVDIMVIAIGFVLRAMAGAVVLAVPISPWLLLCAFLLASFLALCKRRHERLLLEAGAAGEHRPNLAQYNRHLLDQLIAMVGGATIVSYSLYTLWPDTVHKFNTAALAYTIPLVMFGIFRYLHLVYQHDKGGRPEKVLLSDGPLLIDLALYGAAVLAIFLLAR